MGVEGEDALECVRERVRKAGGASSGKYGCVTAEDEEVDELRARRRGEIVCDGSIIAWGRCSMGNLHERGVIKFVDCYLASEGLGQLENRHVRVGEN